MKELVRLKKNKSAQRGFTFIEAMMVTVIFVFLMIGVTQVLNLGNDTFPLDLGQVDLQYQARQGMQWLTRELREASNIQINNGLQQIIFDNYNGEGIKYFRDSSDINGDGLSNQIIREFPAGTRRVVANCVSSLAFTLNHPLLRIDINTAQTVKGRPLVFSLSQQVRLRNE